MSHCALNSRTSVLGGCSKHVAQRQQSYCRQMCCVCAEQRTICRWTSGADVLDLPKPSVLIIRICCSKHSGVTSIVCRV